MKYPIHFLEFADARGLDAPEFNTLRLGQSWDKRLKKGERVLLAHKHQIIGAARVVSTISGPKAAIVSAYARSNHVELALAQEQGDEYAVSLAPHRRLTSMAKNYGPRTFDRTQSATAIVLRRL